MKKSNKITLTVSSLIVVLGLSGCSFDLIKTSKGADSIPIRNEIGYDSEMCDYNVDTIMSFPEEPEDFKEVKDYKYLIERTTYTEATLAHVVSEKTIVSDNKKLFDVKALFDGKTEIDSSLFENPVIQPITLPVKYPLFGIESLEDLVDSYGTCEITGKKLVTLNDETLYCFDAVFTFNHMAELLGFDFKEGDQILASTVYRLNDLGQWELLYRKQTGKDYDTPNVLEANFNYSQDLIVPVEDTVFGDLIGEECPVEYIYEALDEYNGTNNYYDESNEGKKFGKYIKY